MEGPLWCVGRELKHWKTIDVQRLRAGECSFHAFDEVIAVGFKLLLPIEIETRIVIDPADQVDVAWLARDEQVCRVRAVITVHRFFRFLGNLGHEDREAAVIRTEVGPSLRVSGANGRRRRPGGRGCGPGGRGWWPFCMLLRSRREAEP
jgi:hypothetical protein